MGIILTGRNKKSELTIFVYGFIMGGILEVFGNHIVGYQKFLNPDFLSIPLWLPICWGYAFVVMKRVSLIMATGSPWTKK